MSVVVVALPGCWGWPPCRRHTGGAGKVPAGTPLSPAAPAAPWEEDQRKLPAASRVPSSSTLVVTVQSPWLRGELRKHLLFTRRQRQEKDKEALQRLRRHVPRCGCNCLCGGSSSTSSSLSGRDYKWFNKSCLLPQSLYTCLSPAHRR